MGGGGGAPRCHSERPPHFACQPGSHHPKKQMAYSGHVIGSRAPTPCTANVSDFKRNKILTKYANGFGPIVQALRGYFIHGSIGWGQSK